MSDIYTPRQRSEVALTPDGPSTLRHFGRHCSCERCDKMRPFLDWASYTND